MNRMLTKKGTTIGVEPTSFKPPGGKPRGREIRSPELQNALSVKLRGEISESCVDKKWFARQESNPQPPTSTSVLYPLSYARYRWPLGVLAPEGRKISHAAWAFRFSVFHFESAHLPRPTLVKTSIFRESTGARWLCFFGIVIGIPFDLICSSICSVRSTR